MKKQYLFLTIFAVILIDLAFFSEVKANDFDRYRPNSGFTVRMDVSTVSANSAPMTSVQAPPASEPEYSPDAAETVVVSYPLVRRTTSGFIIDGEELPYLATSYNIGGYYYFGLRDIARALKSTPKKFNVVYDETTRSINIISEKDYSSESEIAPTSGDIKTATQTTSKIYVDGNELSLTVYNIDNRNNFRLRDLAEALDFAVAYDNASKTIIVDTSKAYEQ